jgi:ABC-type branched-subunit amino acid transport system permease subunit
VKRVERRNIFRYFTGIALLLAVLLPLLAGMSFYILNVAIIMLIFILFTSAWNFLAYSGQASLGHAAFFGIGGYVSTLIARATGFPSRIPLRQLPRCEPGLMRKHSLPGSG